MSYESLETSDFSGSPLELYKITWGNSAYFYTSSDAVHVFDEHSYQPEAISRDEIDTDAEAGSGQLTITVPASLPVARMFKGYLPSITVQIEIFRTHRGDTQYEQLFKGKILTASFEDSACELICQPASSRFSRKIPRVLFQSQCTHDLYSKSEYYGYGTPPGGYPYPANMYAMAIGCNVIKENYRVDTVIEIVDGVIITAAAFATKPNGWFMNGTIELENGEIRHIVAHTGSTIELAYPLEVAVGEAVAVYAGCDGLESTCRDKFNNIKNFSGFTRMPTRNPFNSALTY